MIEFKPYQAKPVTRMAFQLTDKLEWAKVGEATYMVAEKTIDTTRLIRFTASEEPKIGDWVIRISVDDTYHCPDAVFRDRHIV